MKLDSLGKRFPLAQIAALFLLIPTYFCEADIRLPAIFGDHMVIQEGSKIPVWGWADPGEGVAVTLGRQTAKTTAGSDGRWRVEFEPMLANDSSLTLTVLGKNSVTISDVLVGDVWFCSGQSNMAFPTAGAHNATAEIPKARDSQMRFFIVGQKVSLHPEADVVGQWVVCSPETTAKFSAIGYFFGRELRGDLKKPIGLIGSYWSGIPAQAWISLSGFEKDPAFTDYIAAYRRINENFAKAEESYPKRRTEFEAMNAQWMKEVGAGYQAAQVEWAKAVQQAKINGQPEPPKPRPTTLPPRPPDPPDGGPNTPTGLFNGMVAPLTSYPIKGVIWYQGESNVFKGLEYQALFPRLINDWREKWGLGDFPFLFVQLANFGQHPPTSSWALVREGQLKTLSLPNTGMAVTIDIGDATNVHPKDKLDVGVRLALAARKIAYAQDLAYSGPIYDSMKIEGNKIRLFFKHAKGLKVGMSPWIPDKTVPKAENLTEFVVAGEDKTWVCAKAKIDGSTIVVSSDAVPLPVAVRYGWSNNPSCNLYNDADLPASPFRTDNWNDR